MTRIEIVSAVALGTLGALALVRCVGDATVTAPPADGGADTSAPADGSVADTSTGDVSQGGPDTGPPSVGTLAWVQHYGTNMNGIAVDIAPDEHSGPAKYDMVGSFNSASMKVGSFTLGPSLYVDGVVAQLDSSGNAVWTKTIAGVHVGTSTDYDDVQSVAVDDQGDIYIAGYTTSGTLTLANAHSGPFMYVAKLKGDGSMFVWDHVYTGTLEQPRLAVHGKSVGLSLYYLGTATYDPSMTVTSTAGSYDVFASELNASDGTTKWATSFGGTATDADYGVAVTDAEDLVVVGEFAATMTGTGSGFPLDPKGTGNSAFVVELAAADGKGKFGLAYGSATADTQALGVTYRSGKIVVAGTFAGGVDFGQGAVGSAGSSDGMAFVLDDAKQTTDLVTTMGGTAYDVLNEASLDPWGNLSATGYYLSVDAKAAGKNLKAATFHDYGLVAAKWDSKGNGLWAHGVVPTNPDGTPPFPDDASFKTHYDHLDGWRLKTTSSGSIVIAGTMNLGCDFGDTVYRTLISTTSSCFGIGIPICTPDSDEVVISFIP